MMAQRHRAVYAALKEDMAREDGIHALQLQTLTPAEEERKRAKDASEEASSK